MTDKKSAETKEPTQEEKNKAEAALLVPPVVEVSEVEPTEGDTTNEEIIELAKENSRLYNENVNNVFDTLVDDLTQLIGDRPFSEDERRGFAQIQTARSWFVRG